MNKIYEASVKGLSQFQKLPPAVALFFCKYFELWIQRDGCHESNQYFADQEGVTVKTIERRFKALRDSRVLKTVDSRYFDPGYTNKSGFMTTRKIELDPLFKSQMLLRIEKIKEELARRKTLAGAYKGKLK